MFLDLETMVITLFGLIANGVFDNLDFKPKNEINNLTQLLDLI